MRRNKWGTYLVEFKDGTSIVCGNNYKPWWQHATEYIYRHYGDKEMGWRYRDVDDVVKNVKYSGTPFADDGGLKWASLKSYDNIIDAVSGAEGKQLTPVKYIRFISEPAEKATLTKKLKEY